MKRLAFFISSFAFTESGESFSSQNDSVIDPGTPSLFEYLSDLVLESNESTVEVSVPEENNKSRNFSGTAIIQVEKHAEYSDNEHAHIPEGLAVSARLEKNSPHFFQPRRRPSLRSGPAAVSA